MDVGKAMMAAMREQAEKDERRDNPLWVIMEEGHLVSGVRHVARVYEDG